MTEYKLGDYVRIHDHDGTEITVKITDSGIPNRQGDFAFKAGARMFKNSEILGLGEVPVVSEKRAFTVGERVRTIYRAIGTIDHISGYSLPYRVDFGDGRMGWYGELELHAEPTLTHDTEVHAKVETENDVINSPAHYTSYPVEVIELTEHMNFCRGNAVKYVARAGLKDPSKEVEDLRKAIWYLEREISRVEQAK